MILFCSLITHYYNNNGIYTSFFVLFLFYFGATSGKTQKLFLTLHSVINPVWARDIIWDVGDQTWFGYVQGKFLTLYIISPNSTYLAFLN